MGLRLIRSARHWPKLKSRHHPGEKRLARPLAPMYAPCLQPERRFGDAVPVSEDVAYDPEYPIAGFLRLVRCAHYWSEAVDLHNLRDTDDSRARWRLLLAEHRDSATALVRHAQAHGDQIVAGLMGLTEALGADRPDNPYRLGEMKRVAFFSMRRDGPPYAK